MPKSEPIYLDHNAGAPMRPTVRDAMIDALNDTGNASSVHGHGRKARGRIEKARQRVARLCGAKTRAVTFVSGATEANMTALTPIWQDQGAPLYLDKLIRSAVEHPSVLSGGRFAVKDQRVVPVDSNGIVDLEELAKLLDSEDSCLVSIMAANNETGVIQPFAEIGALVRENDALFHVDAVQAAGRMPIDMEAWHADAVSVSAHKFGGPQGIGALVVRSTARVPAPLINGGGQENWRRSGTENVAAIAGFGEAAERALDDLDCVEQIGAARDRLEAGIQALCPGAIVFGKDAPRLANTTCFAVEGIPAETALIAFDLEHVSVSSGSACSSGKVSASHVLSAMGYSEEIARGAIRVSLGWDTGTRHIDRFLEVWPKIIDRLNPQARTRAA
ncbi:cysteine desulfurase [Roseibium hamelinense]|uniref:Cysteine desulfurase n=1 Tax=Roseibium hamelinense TaxID=150831 RepID=A0A562THQ2_9HYPH|nr:cysteine desulfurase family protein [Roseibium hamelinense]MTI45646.1 cysteine desulfurase [Roseibium hamelinense]TWI93171.1 cysteine desulfurase [Roseibium hamelinense]